MSDLELPDPPTWRSLLAAATARLGDHAEARRIVEEASGFEGAELVLHLDEASRPLTHSRWVRMTERRANGEPLQYVLGRWGFRTLDLHVDHRVLIPRPETEQVVQVALDLLDGAPRASLAVDLGTGSGAIALSLAVERPALEVWAVERSRDALDVARANLAGTGSASTRVRLVEGSWFDALPHELAGEVDLVVANPPYVASGEVLPAEVARWEPAAALVAGPTGLEAIEEIVPTAPRWLHPGGALVVEIGETQADAALALARAAGFGTARVEPDLAGRPRALAAVLS